MYNFFKKLFGFNSGERERDCNDCDQRDQFFTSCPEESNHDDEMNNDRIDDMIQPFRTHPFMNFLQFEKLFEKMLNEMERQFSFADFDNFPQTAFDDMERQTSQTFSSPYEPPPHAENLRDYYLNPAKLNDPGDVYIDGNVGPGEVNRLLKDYNIIPNPQSTIDDKRKSVSYRSSISVRMVRQPDGSVKIIKRIKDSNGADETVVTEVEPPRED